MYGNNRALYDFQVCHKRRLRFPSSSEDSDSDSMESQSFDSEDELEIQENGPETYDGIPEFNPEDPDLAVFEEDFSNEL